MSSENMIAVITGDVQHSDESKSIDWQNDLQKVLKHLSLHHERWQVMRGDSFQLEVQPEDGFISMLWIRSKMIQHQPLDARMALGIGEQQFKHKEVTRSTGSAFTLSGRTFDKLTGKEWKMNSANQETDDTINLMLELAGHTIGRWKPVMAETMLNFLQHPNDNQSQLANRMNKSQSTISEALNAAGYSSLMRLDAYYRQAISRLWR
jgi:hypothetical protein